MRLKLKLAKRVTPKTRVKTQLELDTEEQLKILEEIRAQREEFYQENEALFERMDQYAADEELTLGTIRRLAHTTTEPSKDLNMVTSKTARLAEGRNFVVEVQYKKTSSIKPEDVPTHILLRKGVVKSINLDTLRAIAAKDRRCDDVDLATECKQLLKQEKWQTPSVSVKRLEEATPPGGDPKYAR